MVANIDTRVPLDFNPAVVQGLDGYAESTAHLVGETETALSEAYQGIAQVYDARAAADRNPVWNEAARVIETYNLAERLEGKLNKRIFTARTTLERGIATLEQELSAPVTTKASHPVASEIRAYAKGLSTGERMTFIRGAIAEGDETTATALLGAPPYLSGLDGKMQALLTREFHERMNPEAAKRVRLMKAADALLADRHSALGRALEKAIGAPPAKVRALREAKTAAERHFVMQAS
ncbi:hypothetical protein [Blastomonas sp.]|uniref:hypothetical protein n=1 Tax=Blastomonas sp. TaxID=1909299 RepID=UPI00406A86E5